jgi:hypothetical protein
MFKQNPSNGLLRSQDIYRQVPEQSSTIFEPTFGSNSEFHTRHSLQAAAAL